jgi:H+/Cl- antiporter ClcA
MSDGAARPELSPADADATIASAAYAKLLVFVSSIGVLVSLATWLFLEGTYQLQRELFKHLPDALGYEQGPPKWWYLPVLAVGGLLVALAIVRLPGNGGHVPADGLAAGAPQGPEVLPGVVLAGGATIGFGMVLGPEAPLIAIGAGLAALTIKLARRDTPDQVLLTFAAAGSCTAMSFIFASPLAGAVLLIEAAGLGGARLRVVLVPCLLAAGLGSLVSLGFGSFTGLSSAAYKIGTLPLDHLQRVEPAQFGWTIVLAIAVALAANVAVHGGRLTHRFVSRRSLALLLPAIGLVIAGVAIGFSAATGKSVDEVLFSGEAQLSGLVSQAGAWPVGTVLLLVACKGLAYTLSLGSYRGGPTFPALFIGAAAGIIASHLPGFPESAAIAVGIGAATAAVLRLPLAAVVLATLLTNKAGSGVEPLIIVGVVVAYVVTVRMSVARPAADVARDAAPAPESVTAPGDPRTAPAPPAPTS